MTCSQCRFWRDPMCKRFPIDRPKDGLDWCGEFKLPKKEARVKKIANEHPRFREFFDAYYRTGDDTAAHKAFIAVPELYHQAIIDGGIAWTAHWENEKKEKKWVKLPATFINAGTWRSRPPMHERGPKDCVGCGKAYATGHKYVLPMTSPVTYKCEQCRKG